MVQGGQSPDELPHHLGQPPIIGGTVGKVLYVSDRIIRQVAHRAGVERREPFHRIGGVTGQQLFQDGKRVPLRNPNSWMVDPAFPGRAGKGEDRVPSQEGPACPSFPALQRFEQKTGRFPDQFVEDAHRSFPVGQ